MKICELQPSERPYERLEKYGASALSDEELLAIVLKTGTKGKSSKEIAAGLLSEKGTNGLCGLLRSSVQELSVLEGVGRVKAITLIACMEIGRRCVMSFSEQDRIQFLSEEIARKYFEEKLAFLETEEVHAVFLDTQIRLISHEIICKGGLNCVNLSFREVFRHAVKLNCAGLILAHNHPGGDPTPSPEDIEVTKNFVKNGQMIGVDVIDHIVVGRGVSVSMLSKKLLEVEK